jgi:hypothetical protein
MRKGENTKAISRKFKRKYGYRDDNLVGVKKIKAKEIKIEVISRKYSRNLIRIIDL